MTSSPRLVCLGNFTFDDVVLPDGSERPGCTGGDALYAALAARLIEPRCELVAPVGRDFPQGIVDQVSGVGLSLDGMPKHDRTTLHNRVAYHADGTRTWTIYDDDAAFDAMSPRLPDIPANFRGAEAFLILAMTLEAQKDLVRELRRETDALIALDPQEDYIFGNEQRLADLISAVDTYLPSAVEVERQLGHTDWAKAARQLAALGPKIIVIKLGGEGCLVYEREKDRLSAVPAVSAEVIDTTGAGDSFCGGFMASYLQDGDPVRAAKAGAAIASFTVEGYGVDPLWTLSRERLAERI